MAHWAEIDENNVVLRVTVGDNNEPDEGYQWLIDNLGGTWVKTSYNTHAGVHVLGGTPFRKNYAGIGYYYDEERDAFRPPKPFRSWILNDDTCLWEAPVARPTDDKYYKWDEETLSWIEIPTE
jgi:glyoxylase-like metal-dependent hydrolase (beta-lactamase superfamily II)